MTLYTKNYFRGLAKKDPIEEIKSLDGLPGVWDDSTFDIFLSHSYLDKEVISGIYREFQHLGYKIYVDWITDPQLSRNTVNKSTVLKIKKRLDKSRCLLYATSSNSSVSKWMPWELGYMSGKTNHCAILPVFEQVQTSFRGQEFLSVYPYVSKEEDVNSIPTIWINNSLNDYTSLDDWLKD